MLQVYSIFSFSVFHISLLAVPWYGKHRHASSLFSIFLELFSCSLLSLRERESIFLFYFLIISFFSHSMSTHSSTFTVGSEFLLSSPSATRFFLSSYITRFINNTNVQTGISTFTNGSRGLIIYAPAYPGATYGNMSVNFGEAPKNVSDPASLLSSFIAYGGGYLIFSSFCPFAFLLSPLGTTFLIFFALVLRGYAPVINVLPLLGPSLSLPLLLSL